MLDVLTTLFFEHDLLLVALAALVCVLASFAATTLLVHARKANGRLRRIWLSVAAVAIGSGIWSTHFIAMLAFDAGMPTGYDIGLTVASLLVACAFSGAGLFMASAGERPTDAALGGAIAGMGISAMHYMGMASVIVGGQISWDPALVASSILVGIFFGALAFHICIHGKMGASKIVAALVFTLAICSMHFTAMGAAGFENCYPIISDNDSVAGVLMPIAVASASLMILMSALGGVHLEMRDQRLAMRETDRMRELANAAVEGLVVCDGDIITTVNESFSKIAGIENAPVGRPVTDFIEPGTFASLTDAPNTVLEAELKSANGGNVPVELILRPVDFGGTAQVAIAIRDLSSRKEAEQYIRYLAHHDPLTGLPNRASFADHLEREVNSARRHGSRLAVLCIDLDRFKQVNDLFGHAVGDALLKRVGVHLSEQFHEGQFAARLSGDEFAIVLPEIGATADAGRVASQVLEAFDKDNQRDDSNKRLAASIGIAVFPENGDDPTQLMSNADTALYRAKQEGRGTYYYFEEEMGAEVRDKRLLEHDLRNAIVNGELRLVYQPQASVKTGEITGFEALLRWKHPERGEISPGVFIPLAEESGLILQLGEWVIETACREAANWKNPIPVAVNVSTVQLHTEQFPERLHAILAETGLSPSRLEIEITETALVKDMARAISSLAQIKALGVRIAMDDFGTGYSSLSNLRAFSFDKIKIDQSFIRSVDQSEQSATIVKAVLGLGNGLNLPVLAEGVERMEELSFLRDEICTEAQGYLLGHPDDISAYTAYTHGDLRTIVNIAEDVQADLRQVSERSG